MPILDQNDFMIVSMARSGTSFLKDLINSAHGYHCLGEIFRRHGDSLDELSRLLKCSKSQVLQKKDQGKAEFWRQVRLSPGRGTSCLGAKLFYIHADWNDALWDDMRSLNIIHLIRGNALELFVSTALANRSNIWKSNEYDSRYDAGSIVVAVEEFLEFKRKRDQHVREVRERYGASRYLEVFYEDLVEPNGLDHFLRSAFGESKVSVQSSLWKQRRRPLKDLIANYSDVAAFDHAERSEADPVPQLP